MKEITCNVCDGTGIVATHEMTMTCCNRLDVDGYCCGDSKPEWQLIKSLCKNCRGTGLVEEAIYLIDQLKAETNEK